MDFLNKFKNRYSIITLILIILMLILSLQLASLTIAQGSYYRDLSNNKRLKEVHTTAPRGEIRDRHGRLLAGNKPSFTVQLLKDEINLYETEEKNHAFLNLVRLLEEDGVNYIDDFPIELNVFGYKSEDDYIKEDEKPTDKVIELIKDKNLLNEVLRSYYIYEDYDEHFEFITINRTINALESKGINVPINASIEDNKLKIAFDDKKDIEQWKKELGIAQGKSPIESLISLIDDDKTIIRKTIDHSLARKLVFEMLKDKGLADNLTLEDFSISYMEEYLEQKRTLGKMFPEVSIDTKAKDDFVNIFIETSLENFLYESFSIDDSDESIVPGEILIGMIEEKGEEVPIDLKIDETSDTVIYEYTGTEDIGDESLVDLLIKYAEETSVLSKFIQSKDIRSLAQEQLLKDGINPRISVADDFEYVGINNLKNFYTENKIDEDSTVEEAFDILFDRYEIDKDLSKYEARGIFIIYNQLKKQGYRAYQPVNIAYGLKESTVAKIEEGLMEISGIDVSIEPIRYYPEGESAAHILGYLGKISQANEIEKYVEEAKYSPNDIIGKTGIEESFEGKLRGQNGIKTIEVDSAGNTTSILDEEKPVPGDNIYLTIDLDLQKVAENALEQTIEELSTGGTFKSEWGNFPFGRNRRKGRPYENATSGAVVAIDVNSGQVLASASYPSYDPNLFATGISDSDWLSLLPENENDHLAPRPLRNIATQASMEPGSIYKMATALTALEKGLSPDKKIRDMGYIDIGTSTKSCLLWSTSRRTHGPVDVRQALRDSCNYYFYSLALGRNQKTGESLGTTIEIEDIIEMSKKLGLDDKTGIEINVPAESSGGIPDPLKKIQNNKNMLKLYLDEEIDYYFEEDFEYDDEYKDEVIEEILSWMEMDETPSRGEVFDKLREMRIEPEKRKGNSNKGIVDIIKFDYLNDSGWKISDTLDVTIGQGRGSYTPIQMANYVATIANGGYKHKLSLIDNIKNYNNSETKESHEVKSERIELGDYSNLEAIKEGMRMVSETGTASQTFRNFPVKTGTKTGTVQRDGVNPVTGESIDDFSWFVGFAPYDQPEIAVAAVIFQGGSGGYSGPLVREIMAEYLGLNKSDKKDDLSYDNTLSE